MVLAPAIACLACSRNWFEKSQDRKLYELESPAVVTGSPPSHGLTVHEAVLQKHSKCSKDTNPNMTTVQSARQTGPELGVSVSCREHGKAGAAVRERVLAEVRSRLIFHLSS